MLMPKEQRLWSPFFFTIALRWLAILKHLVQSPHLTDEETEAQREGVNAPWSQSESEDKPRS